MPEQVSEEDFEKKWVTSYQPPGGAESRTERKSGSDISTTHKKMDSVLKHTSEVVRSTTKQLSMLTPEGKLVMKRRSNDSYEKRTSFYVPPSPAEEDDSKTSASPSRRLSFLTEESATLLQTSAIDQRQSTRFVKYDSYL